MIRKRGKKKPNTNPSQYFTKRLKMEGILTNTFYEAIINNFKYRMKLQKVETTTFYKNC